MDTALLSIRVLLVAVFLVASVAKLADLQGSRQAIIDFGLPAGLATPLGLLLPLTELAVVVALIPVTWAWWGAVGALALLLLFTVVIGVTLARGRTPDCHCFGQLHSEPVGWQTLARNGVLAIAASFLVWQGHDDPGSSLIGWIGNLTNNQLIVLVIGIAVLGVLAIQGWLLINLMRQNGRLLLRMDKLESRLDAAGVAPVPAPAQPVRGLLVGNPAPEFELPLVFGGTLTLEALCAKAKPVLLIFSDPDCGPCKALMPDIRHWQRQYANKLTLALISRGTVEANLGKSAEVVLLQHDREVAEAYQTYGTPGAVLVHPDGTIGSPLVMGTDAIKALVAHTTGTPTPEPTAAANGTYRDAAIAPPTPPRLKSGKPAPSLTLPALNGKSISLSDLRGRETLVFFWNPSCGYCTQMLADLQAWDRNPPKGSPQLLVISTGTVEANRAMSLQSSVVLDPGFYAGQAFGVVGTPSAVLVDADGKIASQVAVGATAVLVLMRARPDQPKQNANILVAS